MVIAVIGGSGFIGTRLVARLLDAGHEVRILDKSESAFYPVFVRKCDVRELPSLISCLSGCNAIINLAAEHRDDVSPRSLYDDVNVMGARNVCKAAEIAGINKILFTSSVAVYGFAEPGTDENGAFHPFNDYGRTKMEAEKEYRSWLALNNINSLFIVRPTVVFGERNRGNVYNLFQQIASGLFAMVGRGDNVKSMCYVENIAALIEYGLTCGSGEHLYNYVDAPDFDMNRLVSFVRKILGKKPIWIRIPYWMGYLGGALFDFFAFISGKKFPISRIRVKKFCADTAFSASKALTSGFRAPIDLEDGIRRTLEYEFLGIGAGKDSHLFYSE